MCSHQNYTIVNDYYDTVKKFKWFARNYWETDVFEQNARMYRVIIIRITMIFVSILVYYMMICPCNNIKRKLYISERVGKIVLTLCWKKVSREQNVN